MDSALYQTGHPKIRVWGTVFPLTLQSAEQDCDDIAFAAQSPLARLTRIYRWSSLPRAEQAEILLIAGAVLGRHNTLSMEHPQSPTASNPQLCLANLCLLRNRDSFSMQTLQLWKGMLLLKFSGDSLKMHSLIPEAFYLHILIDHSSGCD